jgi:integrase
MILAMLDGRPTRFHDLRHLYASIGYAAGVSMKELSEGMGHSSPGITSTIYAHFIDGAMAAQAKTIDEFMTAAREKAARKAR